MSRLWFLLVLMILFFTGPATIQAGEDPPTPILLDEPVTAELVEEFAFYELMLDTPNLLNFSLTSTDFDPLLTVTDVDTGETLVTVDDSQGSLNAYASDVLAQAGVYQIAVSSSDGSGRGEYTLGVASGVAGIVEIGDAVEGIIEEDSSIDRYLITLEEGDQIVMSLVAADGLDVTLELLDGLLLGAPYIIDSDYDSGQGYDALLGPYQAPYDQMLIITASGYAYDGDSSREYTLSVERVAPKTAACGDEMEGSLEVGSTGDYYAIDVEHGVLLSIYAAGIESFDPTIALYTPDNRLYDQDDDGGAGRDAEIRDVWTWTAGTHTVSVRAYELASAGDYTLTFECQPPLTMGPDPTTAVADVKIGRNAFVVGEVDAGFSFELVVEGLEDYTATAYIDGNWDGSIDGTYVVQQDGLLTIEIYTQGGHDIEYQVSLIEG